MTLCLGKKDKGVLSGPWDRDLDTDLEAIRVWGAEVLVCLVEDFELEFLHVPDLPDKAMALGIRWYHLPIVDLCAPDEDFEVAWERAGEELRGIFRVASRIMPRPFTTHTCAGSILRVKCPGTRTFAAAWIVNC